MRTARALILLALTAAALTATAPAADAAKPCWVRLVNDWYDGRIDKAYPVKCYRDAIKNLPEDVQAYTDARDAINRALLKAVRTSGKKQLPPQAVIQPEPRTVGADGRADDPDAETAPGDAEPDEGGEAVPPATGGDDDGDGGVLGVLEPSNADSIPVPLIVLAGLALLLLAAAAAGYVTRRIQTRRVRLAPGPQRPDAAE